MRINERGFRRTRPTAGTPLTHLGTKLQLHPTVEGEGEGGLLRFPGTFEGWGRGLQAADWWMAFAALRISVNK